MTLRRHQRAIRTLARFLWGPNDTEPAAPTPGQAWFDLVRSSGYLPGVRDFPPIPENVEVRPLTPEQDGNLTETWTWVAERDQGRDAGYGRTPREALTHLPDPKPAA